VREWVLEGAESDASGLAERQGWTGIGIDEDAGGQGGGHMELAILAEELGRGAVPADPLYASLLAARLLTAAGSDVEALSAGEQHAAVIRSAKRPLDEASGAELVLGAPEAGLFVTVDDGRLGLYDAASVTRQHLVDRTRSLGDVELKGDPDRTVELAEGSLERLAATAAVLVSADALGGAQRMLDLTVEYVKDRVQFGVPVGSFQAVKHTAAEMLVAIEGARSAVQFAAWSQDNEDGGDDPRLDAWVAKAQASRAASFVADKALFLHGAVGYTWEHDLQLLIKRAKSNAQLFGGPGVYDDRIADGLALVA
jgi:alkylation response protein AidB-like acyl-CoA dehydrogenase